ncbi:MAG: MFS transporter [Gemmatimonadaceae bacterium]
MPSADELRAPVRRHLTRALASRNYRLFFSGQSISLVGTWITRIATSWLVYRLTGSALLLGIVGFCGQIPTLLLAPFAGVLVDRWDRHRILIITQALSLAQSAALAVLTLAGMITVPHVLLLQIAQGLINAFDTPARQAFVSEMVEDRADLPNAIALNSTMVKASRIIGPSIGGLVTAAVGEGWCFALDALSYVAVLASLHAMRLVPRQRERRETHMREELAVGFQYVTRFVPVRTALLLLSLVSIMGMPYTVLMPAISANVLHGGPHTLGFLMTASGAGALGGALYLALLPIVGAGMMVTMAATNTVLQTVVREELRGRVMAFYTMAFLGTAPIGSLIAGIAAHRIGPQRTILFGGLSCIAAGVWFAFRLPRLRELVRPIYVERGILAAAQVDASTKAL